VRRAPGLVTGSPGCWWETWPQVRRLPCAPPHRGLAPKPWNHPAGGSSCYRPYNFATLVFGDMMVPSRGPVWVGRERDHILIATGEGSLKARTPAATARPLVVDADDPFPRPSSACVVSAAPTVTSGMDPSLTAGGLSRCSPEGASCSSSSREARHPNCPLSTRQRNTRPVWIWHVKNTADAAEAPSLYRLAFEEAVSISQEKLAAIS
jgi:hypothetical protein